MWIDHKNSLVCIQFDIQILPELQNQHYLCFSYSKILHICLCFNNWKGEGGGGIWGGITQIHGKAPGLSASGMSPYPCDTLDLKALGWFSSLSPPNWRKLLPPGRQARLVSSSLTLGCCHFYSSGPFLESFSCPTPASAKPFPFLPAQSSFSPLSQCVCVCVSLSLSLSALQSFPRSPTPALTDTPYSLCRMSVASHHLRTK